MKSQLLLGSFLALLFTSSLCFYDSGSQVQMLNQANFDQKVIQDKEGLWLVEFFAPWCGHCKNLAPEWEKAAKALEGIMNIAAVDMTTDQSVGQPYDVKGFPTIKYFGVDKLSPSEYNGTRTAKGIIDFAFARMKDRAMKKIGLKPAPSKKSESTKSSDESAEKTEEVADNSSEDLNDSDVVVLDDDNFDEIVFNSKDAWFIEFYAPWCGHCKSLAPTWAKLATAMNNTDIRIAKVDASSNSKVSQRFNISGYPSLKFFPNAPISDAEIIEYKGARDMNSMESWALQERDQKKPIQFNQLLSQETFDEFCTNFKGVCVIVFFPHIFDSIAEERNNYMSVVESVASEQRGKPFSFMWSEGGVQYDLETTFAVGGSGYPSVLAYSNQKKISSVMRGAFTENNLQDFVKNLVAGKGSFVPVRQDIPKIVQQKPWDGRNKQPETPNEDL